MPVENLFLNNFVGTKVISATPMTRGGYNLYRGWDIPQDEDPSDEGYLVEYVKSNFSEPNHPAHKGYISWSPIDVFRESYQENGSINFGHAWACVMNDGAKIQRKGWNGSNLYVTRELVAGYSQLDVAIIVYPNGSKSIWNPSPTDLVAQDWIILSRD